MKNPRDILIRPIITEKSMEEIEDHNRYTFEVNRQANKIEIRRAVEEIFDVGVEKVNTVNVKGKRKRLGVHEGRRSDWKKALIKLKEGDSIEIFEGL